MKEEKPDLLHQYVPPQHNPSLPCPTCKRPIYFGVEHNPVCAAVQNLESLIYRGAGALEEDQAERWADLHQRMTGVKSEVEEQLRTEIESLKQRISAVEELATRPAAEKPQPPEPNKDKPGDPVKPGDPEHPTA